MTTLIVETEYLPSPSESPQAPWWATWAGCPARAGVGADGSGCGPRTYSTPFSKRPFGAKFPKDVSLLTVLGRRDITLQGLSCQSQGSFLRFLFCL